MRYEAIKSFRAGEVDVNPGDSVVPEIVKPTWIGRLVRIVAVGQQVEQPPAAVAVPADRPAKKAKRKAKRK